MKIKIFTFILFNLLFLNQLSGQGFAANLGYSYVGKNAGYAGVEYRLNTSKDFATDIGFGTYLASENGRLQIIPEGHFSKELFFLMGKLSISSKNFAPSIGINAFNMGQASIGYSFPFEQNNGFKGL